MNYRTRTTTYRGFTIVELLIVIVIIGILAAITVTVFTGVQLKARNAQTATVVNSYRKALISYANANGDYPSSTNACLGTGYADLGGDATPDCNRNAANTSGTTTDTAFNTAIAPYIGNSVPAIATKVFSHPDGRKATGARYYYDVSTTLDGNPHRWWITYYVEGDNKCPVSPNISRDTAWPALLTTPPSSGYFETFGPEAKYCFTSLPNPASL